MPESMKIPIPLSDTLSDPLIDTDFIRRWARRTRLSQMDLDCITTIMLKILDGKCKMFTEEKRAIEILYEVSRNLSGMLLGDKIHLLIERASHSKNEGMALEIYEQRLYAETMIGRPTMKKFKAMLREQGIIGKGVIDKGSYTNKGA